MKPFKDKIITILNSASAEIQRRELAARKRNEFQFAEGLHCAWKILVDMYADYVNQKAKRNPIFRWRIWLGYKKARKAIRDMKMKGVKVE